MPSPASWSSLCPTPRKRKLPCRGSCCKKYLEAGEGLGCTLAWCGMEGSRRCCGAEPRPGVGGLGSSGCKGINPSRSQLEAGESPTLLGKGFM